LPRWHGDALIARSVRFTLLLMAPLAVEAIFGAGAWIPYALLTSILAFLIDTGGPALPRLSRIAVAGATVLAGAALGTLAAGNTVLIALAVAAAGLAYALVESIHPSAAAAGRFFCLSTSVCALYAPIRPLDVAVVACFVLYAWAVSVAWDLATGMWRPSTAPKLRELARRLGDIRRERWVFALLVAAAVAASFLTGKMLGLDYPNWALLAVVIVLRADTDFSRHMIINLMLGTLVGVAVSWTWIEFFPSPMALLLGMAFVAAVRWPAEQLHGALGLGAMAAFIVLLIQLVAIETGRVDAHTPIDRLADITLGCGFSLLAVWVNRALQGRPTRKG
jgi:hypothetical protein